MKKVLFTIAAMMVVTMAQAQTNKEVFHAYLYNIEYDVYLKIDFYDESVEVPGNELYGKLPGFLGKNHNPFCWPITAAKIKDEKTAELSMINDFGSEDLTATLTLENDSVYILRQVKGSTLKVPKNGKWQKLPKLLPFKRKP
ncbi:MAG: hypothetical protein IKM76_06000 [Prevotella sp.]|jgi:hypothetical protein|nr:hypothetical protein [Prevotella sp.]